MNPKLLSALKEAAARLFPPAEILVAYAHGSRIHGRPRPDSDLDIAYYLKEYRQGARLPLRQELLLADDLSLALNLDVDLRDISGAGLEVRGKVLEEGVRIYSGDDIERVRLERELLARYHDAKEAYQRMHILRLKRIAREGL